MNDSVSIKSRIKKLKKEIAQLRFQKAFYDTPLNCNLLGTIQNKNCEQIISGEKIIGNSRVSFTSNYGYGKNELGLMSGETYILEINIDSEYVDSGVEIINHMFWCDEVFSCICPFFSRFIDDIQNLHCPKICESETKFRSLKDINNKLLRGYDGGLSQKRMRAIYDNPPSQAHLLELGKCILFVCQLSDFLCHKYGVDFCHSP